MAIIEDLIVSEYGSALHLCGKRLCVTAAEQTPKEIQLRIGWHWV